MQPGSSGSGAGGTGNQARFRLSRRELFGVVAGGALLAAAGWPPRGAGPYALVLGVAQDGGMPQAGCYAPRCERARERERPRYASSLAIIAPDAGRYYLVDASPDLRRQMDLIDEPGFRVRAQARRPFDGIFLTHAHMGHYLGLAQLGREGLGISPTPCFCSPSMADFLSSNGPWSLLVDEGRLDLRPVEFGRWYEVDDRLFAMAVPVPHRPEFSDTVAWTFRGPSRSLLYLPDIDSWEEWDRDVVEVVRGVDVALLDGTFFSPDEVPGRSVEDIPHPLVPHTMDRLGGVVLAGQTEVAFIHLNNTNPALDETSGEAREIEDRGFSVAREGQRFTL